MNVNFNILHLINCYQYSKIHISHILTFAILLSLFLISCNGEQTSIIKNYRLYSIDDYAFADSSIKIVVESPIIIDDSNQLCVHIKELLSTDSAFHSNLIPISLANQRCTVSIPIKMNTAWIEIKISDRYSIENEYSYLRFAILDKISRDTNSLIPVKNASLYMAHYSVDSSWVDFLKTEIELYPENLVSYPVKWFQLIKNKQMKNKILIEDVNKLNRMNDSPNLRLVKFFAYSLLRHDSMQYYFKIVAADTTMSLINNELISSYLNQILMFSNIKNVDLIKQSLASHYPFSPWIRNRLNDMSWHTWNKDVILNICQHRLLTLPNDIPALSTYISVATGKKIIDTTTLYSMAERLYSLINNSNYLSRLNDPYRAQYTRKNFHNIIIADAYKCCGNDKYALNILSEIALERASDITNAGIAAQKIALIYQSQKNKDSALIWYARAYYWNYETPEIRDSIWKNIIEYIGNTEKSKIIMNSLKNQALDYQVATLSDMPNIVLSNNEIFDFKKTNKDIMMEFFSMSCKPCIINIQKINTSNEVDNVTLILVTKDDTLEVKQFLQKNNITALFASNVSDLYSYFNVIGIPVTIRINNNNEVVYRREGGEK